MEEWNIEDLIGSLEGIPIVGSGEYHYFVHPLSDGIPSIDPDLLLNATYFLGELLPKPEEYDLLITAEAMGIPLAASISTRTGKPFSIARKRRYDLPGEITVGQETGYSSGDLHLNLPEVTGRAVIVDDVLSTGGTLKALVRGIRITGWEVEQAVFLFNKMKWNQIRELGNKTDIEIKTLLDLEFHQGRFRVKRSG
jgi:adenine phosphoribosyltransferase